MVNIQDIAVIAPDSPSAESLFNAFTKVNQNFDLSTPQAVAFATQMPLVRFWTSFAQANLTTTTSFTIPSSVLPGSVLVMRLTGPGPINFPGLNLAYLSGQYRNGFLNIVTVRVLEGELSGAALYGVDIQNVPLGAVSGLVFRQDTRTNAGLFDSLGQFFSVNAGSLTPSSEIKFSRLSQLEQHRQKDGFFYFEIRYFTNLTNQVTATWRQRSNPTEMPESIGAVDGYSAISVPSTFNNSVSAKPFGGICIPRNFGLHYGSCVPSDSSVLAVFKAILGVSKAVLFYPTSLDNPLAGEPGQPATYNPQICVPGTLVNQNTVELYTLTIP